MLREISSGYLKVSLLHMGLLQESRILGLPSFCLAVFLFLLFFPFQIEPVLACTDVNAACFPATGNNTLSV